jgi:hypothetical protein
VGVLISGASSFLAENVMIYGGVPIVGFSAASPSFALSLGGVPGPIIRHSTLYSGPSGFPTLGTAIKIEAGVQRAIVQNNLLAVDVGWNEPFYVEPCASTGVFERVENNLLFNTGDPALNILGQVFGYGADPQGAGCGAWQGFYTVDALEDHLRSVCTPTTAGACTAFGGTKVSGNRTLKPDCGADTGCITWTACGQSSLPCLQSVFDGWSAGQNGLDTLFGPGWKLAAGVPCAIAESSLAVGVGADLFGTSRTTPPSMGAHELDDACTP